MSMLELLKSRSLLVPLGIGIVMQLSQQLSGIQVYSSTFLRLLIFIFFLNLLAGINAVFYYSTNLFIGAGLQQDSAKYATIGGHIFYGFFLCVGINSLNYFVGVGAIMVCMTLVTIPLMDRAGRRTLHLWGLGGMFAFSILMTISLLLVVLLKLIKSFNFYSSNLYTFKRVFFIT